MERELTPQVVAYPNSQLLDLREEATSLERLTKASRMGCNMMALVQIIIMCVYSALEPPTLFDIVSKTESSPQPLRARKSRVITRMTARYCASAPHPDASIGRRHFTRHRATQGLSGLRTPAAGWIARFHEVDLDVREQDAEISRGLAATMRACVTFFLCISDVRPPWLSWPTICKPSCHHQFC